MINGKLLVSTVRLGVYASKGVCVPINFHFLFIYFDMDIESIINSIHHLIRGVNSGAGNPKKPATRVVANRGISYKRENCHTKHGTVRVVCFNRDN